MRSTSSLNPTAYRNFSPPINWSSIWPQAHLQSLDCTVVDLTWQVAYGVVYTAFQLVSRFAMRSIGPMCQCCFDEETLVYDCQYCS